MTEAAARRNLGKHLGSPRSKGWQKVGYIALVTIVTLFYIYSQSDSLAQISLGGQLGTANSQGSKVESFSSPDGNKARSSSNNKTRSSSNNKGSSLWQCTFAAWRRVTDCNFTQLSTLPLKNQELIQTRPFMSLISIDRAISQFKYQGRWSCRDLVNKSFVPTEQNAKSLKTWKYTGGHSPLQCRRINQIYFFKLFACAVNCYTQWISGLSCPQFNISLEQQYNVAKNRLLRYNFILDLGKLKDPLYVQNVEQMFGVQGLARHRSPYCQPQADAANKKLPPVLAEKDLSQLTRLNKVDIGLYKELTDCHDGSNYNFPKWDPNRFDLNSTKH